MNINAKSFQAIEAVLDVAILGTIKPITLAEVGRHRGIALPYLEAIFPKLREHGLVRGTRGHGGGYRLNRRLSAISIADIVSAVDGAAPDRDAAGRRSRGGASPPTRNRCSGLKDDLRDYLRSVTLASLVEAAMEDQTTVSPPLLAAAMTGAGRNMIPQTDRAKRSTPKHA